MIFSSAWSKLWWGKKRNAAPTITTAIAPAVRRVRSPMVIITPAIASTTPAMLTMSAPLSPHSAGYSPSSHGYCCDLVIASVNSTAPMKRRKKRVALSALRSTCRWGLLLRVAKMPCGCCVLRLFIIISFLGTTTANRVP